MKTTGTLALVGLGLIALGGCSASDGAETGDDQNVTAQSGSSIPEGQLTDDATLTVVADLLNCREKPGTSGAVVTQFKKNDSLRVVPPEDVLTIAHAPDGQLWVLVSKAGAEHDPCYVAADTRFIRVGGASPSGG